MWNMHAKSYKPSRGSSAFQTPIILAKLFLKQHGNLEHPAEEALWGGWSLPSRIGCKPNFKVGEDSPDHCFSEGVGDAQQGCWRAVWHSCIEQVVPLHRNNLLTITLMIGMLSCFGQFYFRLTDRRLQITAFSVAGSPCHSCIDYLDSQWQC